MNVENADRTLLHVCCGPCASACVPRLREQGRKPAMFFANSNLDTREEYDRRLQSARRLAEAEGAEIFAAPYDHGEWLREVADGLESEPEKGARCARCFRYNLAKAAEYAAANGYGDFATSLTVSPHKDSKTVFAAGEKAAAAAGSVFRPEDFKKREGFKLSVRRAAELGLYRQAYCGCEFSKWRIRHRAETASTNLDALEGRHGDVFTADFQTAGRGRLDHKWLSPPGANLMMSAVVSVAGLPVETAATLPLAAGLAVANAVGGMIRSADPVRGAAVMLKWPNDVLADGRKIAGILCERHGDNVIIGIGLNVRQREFAPEIAAWATSLALQLPDPDACPPPRAAMWGILRELDRILVRWREGFGAVWPDVRRLDWLRGKTLSVRQTDDDREPASGICGGIMDDGSLDVGGVRIFAGEAHVESF